MSSLKTVSAVLGRCFLLCVALQILALVLVTNLHDWAFGVHSWFFPTLTAEVFAESIYMFMGQLKLAGLVLFLIPWIAIKLVGKKETES